MEEILDSFAKNNLCMFVLYVIDLPLYNIFGRNSNVMNLVLWCENQGSNSQALSYLEHGHVNELGKSCMKLWFEESRYVARSFCFCRCLILVASSLSCGRSAMNARRSVMAVSQIPHPILGGDGRSAIVGSFSPVLWQDFGLLLYLEF